MIKSNSLSIKTYLCKVKVPLKYDRRCQIKVIVHGKDSWANAQLMFTPQSLAFLSQVINSCALGLGELAGDCIWRQDGGGERKASVSLSSRCDQESHGARPGSGGEGVR